MACNHCGDPACLAHCPAGAYRKDPATGAVTIDAERCIGCKYCTWACPYDAPRFNPELGVMEKCTLCDHRLAEGRPPACVANCPTGALGLADVDPGAGVPAAPGFTRTEIHPAVQFVPPRRGDRPPELTAPASRADVDAVFDRTFPRLPAKITLRAEWPLLVFTSVAALLVAWFSAALLGGPPVRPAVFLLAGGAALLLSAMHLGRKERAWQSLRNLKRSWLSLEILSFPLFLGLGVLQTLLFPDRPVLGALAAAVGPHLPVRHRPGVPGGAPGRAAELPQRPGVLHRAVPGRGAVRPGVAVPAARGGQAGALPLAEVGGPGRAAAGDLRTEERTGLGAAPARQRLRVGAGFGIPLGIALTLGGAPPRRGPGRGRGRPGGRVDRPLSSSTPSWT